MKKIFSNCISLVSLPDLSKWNTDGTPNISDIFENCPSLISLPDISKWNFDNTPSMMDYEQMKYERFLNEINTG